jgi:hypothetical protein
MRRLRHERLRVIIIIVSSLRAVYIPSLKQLHTVLRYAIDDSGDWEGRCQRWRSQTRWRFEDNSPEESIDKVVAKTSERLLKKKLKSVSLKSEEEEEEARMEMEMEIESKRKMEMEQKVKVTMKMEGCRRVMRNMERL